MGRHAHVSARRAPAAGPFSHAVRGGARLVLPGQTGQHPAASTLVAGGGAEQARPVFATLRLRLEDLGLDVGDVVKVGVLPANMSDFMAVNAVYCERCDTPDPARTTVAVREVPVQRAGRGHGP